MIKSFLRDMLTYLPTKLLPALTSLITTPIYTRLFLPDEYGNWALATGLTAFLYAFSVSGLGSTVLRFFPVYKAKSDLNVFFTNLFALIGLVAGAISAISIFILFFLAPRIDKTLYPLLFISVFVFVINSFFSVFMELLRVQKNSGLYAKLNLTNFYGSLLIGLTLVVAFGLGIEGLMYGALLAQILLLPISIRSTIRGATLSAAYINSSAMLTFWSFAWPLAFGNTAFWGLRLSDRFIIEAFRPGFEVGLYSATYNITDRTINLLVNIFILSMGPMVANTWEMHGRESTEQLIGRLTRVFLVICLPVTVGLSLLALPFVTLLTGEAYHAGYRIVGFVAFSTFAWGLSTIAHWGLVLNNKTPQFAINQLLAGAANIGLNLLLVPKYGYTIAAVTTLVGYVLLLVLQAHTSRTYLTWKIPMRTASRVLIAATLMGAGLYWMNILDASLEITVWRVLFKVVVGALIYIGALWFFGEITNEEKNTAIRAFARITKGVKRKGLANDEVAGDGNAHG